jgi:hypothetical protein
MDHEKPEAVLPQIQECHGEQLGRDPSIDEPAYVDDRRERRGDSVW